MYLRTHSCTKVANRAEARLSTRLANQNACVAVGGDVGFGGGGIGGDGREELFALATGRHDVMAPVRLRRCAPSEVESPDDVAKTCYIGVYKTCFELEKN
jgi:hypothetical protein